jgi:hypothetical protein
MKSTSKQQPSIVATTTSSLPTQDSRKINIDNVKTPSPTRTIELDERRERVKEAFQHAYNGYKKFAFGYDEG